MTESEGILLRLSGVTLVGLLTYLGEYISYLVILAWIQDKLVIQFQFATYAPFVVGVVAGAYLVLSGLIAVPFGHLTDRYGRRLFAILGSLIGGVALLGLIGVGSVTNSSFFLVLIGVLLLALGFGHATYTASTWAFVGDISRAQNMGKSYGLLELAEYGGFAFGPGAGIYLASLWGREPTFAFSAILLLAAAAIASLLMRESYQDPISSHNSPVSAEVDAHTVRITWGSFIGVLKNPVIGATLLTTFIISLALQAFYIYVPLFALGISNILGPYGPTSGFLSTLAAGTSIVFMVPLGFIVDSTRRRMPWLVLGLLISSFSLVIVYVLRGFFFLAIAALIFGFALATARVSQAVILAEGSALENRATVMGTNHAVEHAGYGVGALVGGTLITLFGFGNTFRNLAFILLLSAVAFLIFAVQKKIR